MHMDSGARPGVLIDACKPVEAPIVGYLTMGGKTPDGQEISVNSWYFTRNGRPWLPIMGEMHYSRFPERYWEEELLKIKAGGVKIVATYVFWIHHEEIEGEFDWSGQRNLRRFVELCGLHGLGVWVRIGPWVHGECRNGGFPDWLMTSPCVPRTNDLAYLAYVRRFYREIGRQLVGLFWEAGGPVMGVQLENEYGQRGPNAGAAHLTELKRMAQDACIQPPLWTITGWPNPDFPPQEVIPVFGGYPDAFWDETLQELPPNTNYRFKLSRLDDGIGNDLQTTSHECEARFAPYPFITAEAGGGMQVAYHRRPLISADDITAILLTKLGSGVNLHGYYMYHGGANPEGKRTTLQESQETGYPNDLPVVSYDYQAPLGEFGQINPSYRSLKTIHMFLDDFGSYLAPMVPWLPAMNPSESNELRVSARTSGDHGFVFVNNYQRNYALPDHRGVQITLRLPSETVILPRTPVTVTSDAYFIWPVNLDWNGIRLIYATAQLLCKIDQDGESHYFFFVVPGIAPEFAFDARTVARIEAPDAEISEEDGRIYLTGISSGTGQRLLIHSQTGEKASLVVLTREQAFDSWKARTGNNEEHLFLSSADLFWNENRLHLRARNTNQIAFSAFSSLASRALSGAALYEDGHDGSFKRYVAPVTAKHVVARWEKVRDAAPSVPVRKGRRVAAAPEDVDFVRAAIWRITFPEDALTDINDLFLHIDYVGDVARLTAGSQLLSDDFYKGTPWVVGLKCFGPERLRQGLELQILPLRQDAPIYFPRHLWPAFPPEGEIAALWDVFAEPEVEVIVPYAPNFEVPITPV